MPQGLALALALALTIGSGACAADPSPSLSSTPPGPVQPDYALACWSVRQVECERASAEAIARRPAGRRPVVLVEIRDVVIDLEFADGGGRVVTRYGIAADGRLEFGPWTESQVGGFRPTSGPAVGPIVEFTLGHCGLSSPIDVDGSFWDPYGAIDPDDALVNASDGQFRRLGLNEAEFITAGSRVQLRRHSGAKSPPGCD